MSNINNYYPHTLKSDEKVEDDYFKNKDINNLQNLNEADEYVCVFENNGIQYPEIALGLQYEYATTKQERKDICETTNDPALQQEKLIYIRKDDWINPDDTKYECGVFNLDGTRKKYILPLGNPDNKKFVSKKLCDRYNTLEDGYDFYTKMIPSKLETPSKDLRATEVDEVARNSSRVFIFWITYTLLTLLIIYWVARYQVNKPYEFYDNLNSKFMYKVLILIIIFGLYVYLFCPFNMCFHESDTNSFLLNFGKSTKEEFCKYCNNNISYLEDNINSTYDKSINLKNIDWFFNYILKLNRNIEKPLKYIDNKICNICTLEHNCFDRKAYNTMKIVTPLILVVSNLNLQSDDDSFVRSSALQQDYDSAINMKYKYKYVKNDDNNNYYVPYDTGTIIYLRTNDDYDKSLYMCCSVFNFFNYPKRNVIDEDTFVYKWVLIRDRNGPTIYNNDLKKLRLKICPYSHRVLYVDSNYELLDYNLTLDVNTFVQLFETNIYNYKEYPFFPSFGISELREAIDIKPNFIKRKMLQIYKYLIKSPSQKFRTKNIAVKDGNLIRYDTEISIRESLKLFETKNYFTTYKEYKDEYNRISIILNELNEYHNDDELDDEYLSYYNSSHEKIESNFYKVADYKLNYDELYEKLNIRDKSISYKDFMYNLYKEFINLNFIQRDEVRQNIIKKFISIFNEEYDKYKEALDFIKKNKNMKLYETPFKLEIDEGKILDTKEIFIVEEIANYHDLSKVKLENTGVIHECIFCKQKCLVE